MDTMRIGVLKTLSVRNAVKQENTSKVNVATNYTVSIVVKNTVLTLKNAEFGTKKRRFYALILPEIFLSLKRGNLLRPQLPGISYANITQSSMKKVSVVDTATQTDPITILDSAVQSNTTNTNSKTEDLQKQKGQTNTTNKNQTKTPIEEKKGEGGLKKATIEMIRKDWKEQQQKERQARSQLSPPTKETKSKYSQRIQRPSTSNRERKGSNNVIQQHNRFGSLSDSSDDMELGEAPDRPQTNRNRSRSSEHSHVNNSNNRSKSPITYP